jgi:predicted nucleotidyltransferase
MGAAMLDLASLTPEGRILLTLRHGKHSYSELKLETGLSDRWLTVKLRRLEGEGIVERDGRWYGISGDLDVSPYELSLYLRFQAERIADELAKLDFIAAIILFGGVAQGRAWELSDLDMIIVVDGPVDRLRGLVASAVSRLESKYHLTVEPLILAEEDLLDNLRSDEGGIIYGLAEGYRILFDRTGRISGILGERIKEVKQSHVHLEGEGIWLKTK